MTDYDWEMQERKYEHDMAMIDLEAENAELRELVQDMFNTYCVVHDEPLTFRQELDYCVEFWKRIRALEIEVGE